MTFYAGHVLPGTFFILFGIWHVTNIYVNYFACFVATSFRRRRRRAKTPPPAFQSSSIYPCYRSCCWCPPEWPVEGLLKIIATTLGSIGEFAIAYQPETGSIIARNTIHIAMFTGFGLTGLVDILSYYKVPWVPPRSEYVITAIAFTIEGMAFSNHRHPVFHPSEHAVVQATVHTLLVYVIYTTALLVMIEIFVARNVLLSLFRSTLLIVQGTWLCQIEWILSPPWNDRETRWNLFSDDNSMYCVVMFCFNTLGCLAISGLIGWIVKLNIVGNEAEFYTAVIARRRAWPVRRSKSSKLISKCESESSSDSDFEQKCAQM